MHKDTLVDRRSEGSVLKQKSAKQNNKLIRKNDSFQTEDSFKLENMNEIGLGINQSISSNTDLQRTLNSGKNNESNDDLA